MAAAWPARGQETVSLAQLLRRLPLFASLDEPAADELARHCSKRRARRGELIQVQGARTSELGVLLSGRAHSFRTDPRGREVIIDLIRVGDPLGDLALIDGQPHSSSVRSEEECDLLVVPGNVFAITLATRPQVAQVLLLQLSQRVRTAYRRVASLAHQDVGERLLQRLLDLSVPDGDEWVLRERIARQDLAKMIGASREMVSRTMKELETARTIRYRADGSIVLRRMA
ncbi:Crp/Fnr family transcriptional regulator [Ideonella alba]|uniref:Crp/Fnr family transcriptional regulator n=1 Tax=Ideonella alba TaxID=2824118 RepID=A0A941BFQ8_9BURK|nr:Crp/Fnr family transcriptional regulator [Ideonella alba]MBQ0931307.1 Crp/Fnr family transcriptional regulator [Ideonella alba]